MSGTRQRIDPRQRTAVRKRDVAAREASSPPAAIVRPDLWVGAVAITPGSRLAASQLGVLGAARAIADEHGGAVVLVLLLGASVGFEEDVAALGVDRLIVFRHAVFDSYDPDAQVDALSVLLDTHRFLHLLFADEIAEGGDCARRLAAARDERAAMAITAHTGGQVTCRQDGGRLDVTRPASQIMTVAAQAFASPNGRQRGEALALDALDWTPEHPRLRDGGLQPFDAAAVPISEADLVLSAGNGVTDWRSFHELAQELGAAAAGSRAVVDAGHLPRSRQVGASGQLIAPACYLAFGIAGASQHLQGIAQCRRVVAVNTDLHADMVRRADLAIIADAQAVMPALLHRLRGTS